MLKKLKKQLLTTTIMTSMVFPTTTAFAGTSFTDVKQGDWYYSTVSKLADTGIINGTGDGNFNPTGEVSHAEFYKMFAAIAGLEVDKNSAVTDFWAEPYIRALEKAGYNTYYTTARLAVADEERKERIIANFNKPINREQVAGLMARIRKSNENVIEDTTKFDTTLFSDFSMVSKELNSSVRYVVMNGIMGGKDGGVFDPQGNLTRAEAATVIARFLYPEERLTTYNYIAKEEKHNVGDVYTDYNTWLVPTEVKVMENGQIIPLISMESKIYIEDIDKYVYIGMPSEEIKEWIRNEILPNTGFIDISCSKDNQYVVDIDIKGIMNCAYGGHMIGEPALTDGIHTEGVTLQEGESWWFPAFGIPAILEKNIGNIYVQYYTDGGSVIVNGVEEWENPTHLSMIHIESGQIIKSLGISK